jgi:hypothetical protein
MLTVAIYIKDTTTSEYNRVDLFDDEKISVVSSIQNINDISKTYTDFSQTFTVPASKQNNKIFRHWYDNSNDNPFSTLVKSDAYIEIDTIQFRSGKIQLESANLVDGQAQDYSITFVGILGNLKDTFAGLYLKDLTDTTYDFAYDTILVKDKVTLQTTSPAYPDIKFPLISSARNWNYNSAVDPTNNISDSAYPIRSNELFPALRLRAVLNMIENKFGINFDGTTLEPSTFLTDTRFTNAFLWLKNSDIFTPKLTYDVIKYQTQTGFPPSGTYAQYQWQSYDFATGRFTTPNQNTTAYFNTVDFRWRASGTGAFDVELWNVTDDYSITKISNNTQSPSTTQTFRLLDAFLSEYQNKTFEIRITLTYGTMTFTSGFTDVVLGWYQTSLVNSGTQVLDTTSNQVITLSTLKINSQFPEIKIEDFFSGLLKMFNLTCYSTDGINYTVEQLESYYGAGSDVDITKYVFQDKKNLNRVKTYKKINFEYEKSDSFVNVAFNSNAGVEYGSLLYNTNNDGEEYSIKLPFEDINFQNLKDKLQVGYVLKTDYQKYIPKPVILYEYDTTALTTLTSTDFWFNIQPTGGTSTQHTSYKAFGQETLISGVTYGLNFPPQQSTLTNEIVTKGLYNQYYENYFANIFNVKARLIKVSAILPTSVLTSLKLNDNIIIRDAKYLINTMTTDLTTGEVQFELLTNQRQ